MTNHIPTLLSHFTTDQLEAKDTSVVPLSFYISSKDFNGVPYAKPEVGDGVIVRSDDGDDFIGHIVDIDDDNFARMMHVELD